MNRIEIVLKEQERTCRWLEKHTGIPYSSICNYVHNTQQPSIKRMKIIADVLGVKMEKLINL